jgi:ribonuclease HI
MPAFQCRVCGTEFSLPQPVLDRYPGWKPQLCREHRDAGKAGSSVATSRPSKAKRPKRSGDRLLTRAEVLDRFTDGPVDGVFTDGGSVPNPGPGGWGSVYVRNNAVVGESHGHDPDTTNNRMELTALIEGAGLVPEGTAVTVYSDSRLAIRTITEWAVGWERRGWKRKTGPVENLDLVKIAYRLYRDRPELSLEWIAGHAGLRWNEYADALASEWRRPG